MYDNRLKGQKISKDESPQCLAAMETNRDELQKSNYAYEKNARIQRNTKMPNTTATGRFQEGMRRSGTSSMSRAAGRLPQSTGWKPIARTMSDTFCLASAWSPASNTCQGIVSLLLT